MKRVLLGLSVFVFCTLSFAHDEGHGPRLADTGKYGGLVSAVIDKTEVQLGAKAQLVYKAELARSNAGVVRLYLYDSKMKPLDLQKLEQNAKGTLAFKSKGKWKDVPFPLEVKDGVYIGQMPANVGKPYNIDVTLKEGGKEYLTAFDNLD
jgi:hypothetical protein